MSKFDVSQRNYPEGCVLGVFVCFPSLHEDKICLRYVCPFLHIITSSYGDFVNGRIIFAKRRCCCHVSLLREVWRVPKLDCWKVQYSVAHAEEHL